MVPFYGQGLNCGLEDVRVLDVLLREENVDANARKSDSNTVDERLANALNSYSVGRHEDLVTICDLAMDNLYVLSPPPLSKIINETMYYKRRDAPLGSYTRVHVQENARRHSVLA